MSTGTISRQAITRGTTRKLIGSVPITLSASSCSVTFIVPSSAATAPPTRPAIMTAASTGPICLTTLM